MGRQIVSSGCHSVERKNNDFAALRCKVPSLACTTTPCPTAGWPPVTWKESGTHVSLSVQAA
ncbi:unnamed protein product [Spirodela intermedia]|uniref:Uncharacterized protein n=1 Tax=Spirodela intermedia TaxID=51605 RepID=A0A7I8IH98_SPIIN|nr:unnamed protein product [Spirodela intermedia]CAA6657242.1 unnamed protein product [Spirodela intermedia]